MSRFMHRLARYSVLAGVAASPVFAAAQTGGVELLLQAVESSIEFGVSEHSLG